MSKSAISIRGPLIKTLVFTLSTSLVVAFVAIELGGIRFYDSRGYKAIFTTSSDIVDGNPVMVNGVRVGKVSGVSVHDNTQAEVRFEVKDAITLPADTQAVIRYRNLTGDRYLELVPGDADAPLEDGATIPVERTAPALDLDLLVGGLEPLFEGLDDEQINRLASELVAVLQGEQGTVQSILDRTATLTTTLADRDAVIGETIDNLNAVLGTLDSNSQELSQTISALDTVATGLAQDRARLGGSFEQVDTLVDSVDGLLADLRGPFLETVQQVDRLSTRVNATSDRLDEVLEGMPGLYLRIARLGSRGPGYGLYICALRVRLTGADGNPILTPWIGPDPGLKRCQFDASPGETEEDRKNGVTYPTTLTKGD